MPEEIVVPLILGINYLPYSRRSDLILVGPKGTPFNGWYNSIASDVTMFWIDRWVFPPQGFFKEISIVEDTTGELLLWTSAKNHAHIYMELLSTGMVLQIRDEVSYIFK